MTDEETKRMAELDKKIWGDTATSKEIKEWRLLYNKREKESMDKTKAYSKEMQLRRRRGKYGEKKVAKELGMKRDGGVAMRDVGNSMFSIEVKTCKKLPASVDKILSQATRLAKQGTIPIGAFRCGRRVVYVIEGKDWIDLHGGKK